MSVIFRLHGLGYFLARSLSQGMWRKVGSPIIVSLIKGYNSAEYDAWHWNWRNDPFRILSLTAIHQMLISDRSHFVHHNVNLILSVVSFKTTSAVQLLYGTAYSGSAHMEYVLTFANPVLMRWVYFHCLVPFSFPFSTLYEIFKLLF